MLVFGIFGLIFFFLAAFLETRAGCHKSDAEEKKKLQKQPFSVKDLKKKKKERNQHYYL